MGADISEISRDLINISTTIIFSVIGVIGNVLILHIFTRKEFLRKSMFRYLIVAALLDIINLILLWPYNYPDFFQVDTNLMSCKFIMYLSNFAYSANPWFILLSTFDRFLHVYYPHKFKFRNRLKFQLTQMIFITIFMLIINLPFYFYFDLSGPSNYTSCGYVEDIEVIGFTLDFYVSLEAVLVPFVLMLVSTTLIGYKLMTKKVDPHCKKTVWI